MANSKATSQQLQPVVFNGNRLASDRAEQKWIADLLNKGKNLACPSELGMVVLTKADNYLPAKMKQLSDMVARNAWAIGISERADCWRYWRNGDKSERLERLLKVFWPGPLFVQDISREDVPEDVAEAFGRKAPLWMPYGGLCSTILKISGCPTAAGLIRWRNDIDPLGIKEVGELYGSHLELIIDGREKPGSLTHTLLDISGPAWRLVHRGHIKAQQLRCVCGGSFLLSGEAADAIVGSRTSGVRLVVFEGEPERVARRMRAFAEGLSSTESLHYFVHSAFALKAFAHEPNLHKLCGERQAADICDALAWQKLALETWEAICALEKRQEAPVVLLEGVPRNDCTEEFMERITRVAYQVINLMSSDD